MSGLGDGREGLSVELLGMKESTLNKDINVRGSRLLYKLRLYFMQEEVLNISKQPPSPKH